MKKVCLLTLLFAPCFLRAETFHPTTRATLYEHLVTVNREWLRQLPDAALCQPAAFSSDQARIRRHLELVEKNLRAREESATDATACARRARHLRVLRAYWQNGIFPANRYHAARRPYFQDHRGVLCAVGYLLWQDGQQALVARIRQENNYGYIAELAERYPEIGAWADANGFTVAELAWIQPAYEPPMPEFSNWGNGVGLNPGGRINVMAKVANDSKLVVAGHFTSVDGLKANNVAVWDGFNWTPLGAGLDGEVFAMKYSKTSAWDLLLVGGRFQLPGQPEWQNVAQYDFNTGTWKGLQKGDMEGTVYALYHRLGPQGLYVGGDFKKVDGVAHPYIGYRDFNNGGNWNSNLNNPATDGPVRAFADVDGLLLVGGAFKQVWDVSTQSWIPASHIAYYEHFNTWYSLPQDLPEVTQLAFHQGNIYAGHVFELSFNGLKRGMHVLKAGLWFETTIAPAADTTVRGFHPMGNNLLAYGGFLGGGVNLLYGKGLVLFYEDNVYSAAILNADSTIRAVIDFKGHIYVAGDFQHLFGVQAAYKGMARFKNTFLPSPEPVPGLDMTVTPSAHQLTLRYENTLEQPAQLNLYDLEGRLLHQEPLPSGPAEVQLEAANRPPGLYVWQVRSGGVVRSGKWMTGLGR